MAIRIQIRRDVTTNWTTNNPILLPGEIGLETDTLKFKIGNGSRWNDTISYAFKAGEANGLATLGPTGKIPTSQLPDSISMDAELTAALSALTTSVISEGSNKYFTNQRAVDAVSSAISSAIEIEVTNRNTAISNAKSEVITTASNDATNKASAAQSAAIAAASSSADIKDTISAASAVTTANAYTDNKITIEISNRNNAINNAISNEIINRNIAIANATPPSFSLTGHTTNELSEGSTNLYFTNARSLSATASAYDPAGAASNAQAAAATDATTKANAAIATAATDATTKANAAQSAAISTAATDATTKANAAIATAATDATTKANAALVSANTYTDSLSTSLNNTLGDYVLENDRNQASGFAGLNSSGKLLDSVIPASVNAYADAKVAAIVNSAPATLDTLGELAAALQADEAASTTLTTLVGTKAPIASPTFTGTVSGITKSMVGLGNVDNTADSLKPISTATQTALDAKLASSTAASIYAPIASPTFTGTVSGITKSMVGLGNIDNTSDTAKPISTAMQTALDSKLNRTVSTNPQSGSYQIVVGDAFKLIEMNGGGTLTILDSTSFATGTTIEVLQTSDSQVLIAGSGFTPDSTPGLKLRAKWSSATLLKRGTNSWVVMGDLSA